MRSEVEPIKMLEPACMKFTVCISKSISLSFTNLKMSTHENQLEINTTSLNVAPGSATPSPNLLELAPTPPNSPIASKTPCLNMAIEKKIEQELEKAPGYITALDNAWLASVEQRLRPLTSSQ